jgi:alpha-galactosidase
MCPPDYDYTHSNTYKRFEIMRDAILAQSRPMLYSLCEWGEAGVQQWGNQTGSSWRMSGDIEPPWRRILDILNQNSFYLHNTDFWGHSDADMLEVGNDGLTVQECRSHFALWAAMKSPLLIGTDLAKISDEMVDILKNQYLLAFNQDDVFGKPAMPYKWGTNPDWTFNASYPAEFWSGASQQGTLVLMFNPHNSTRTKCAVWAEIPQLKKTMAHAYVVTDVWTGEDLGCVQRSVEVDVEPHDTAAFLIGDACHQVDDPDEVGDDDRRVGVPPPVDDEQTVGGHRNTSTVTVT